MDTKLVLGLVVFAVTACGAGMTGESRGVTQRHHAGAVPLVFTNASPELMCGLHMALEDERDYGDNWLATTGLPSGQSLEVKVKPGTYKATWNTCKTSTKPYFAGTLAMERAFVVKAPTQLFVFVADTVAPTKRAAVREHHTLIKFPGQPIGELTGQRAEAPSEPQAAPVDAAVKLDTSDLIDRKAASRKRTAKPVKPAAALRRSHDLADAGVNDSGR